MKNIPFSLKVILGPMLLLSLVIIVSLFGFRVAFTQIGELRAKLTEATKNENVLTTKLDVLSTSQASVASDTNSAVSYLPGDNPALLVLYQLRSLAIGRGLSVSNISVGAEGKNTVTGFMAVGIGFDVTGDLAGVLDFVSILKTIAPNLKIDKVDLNFVGGNLEASINSKSRWSPFPTKIPALTEPVTALTNAEKDVLSKVTVLLPPPFVSLTAGSARDNLNPFGE